MMARELYKITFSADGIPDAVMMPDETAAQVSGGYGGWQNVQRLRRVSLTVWQGRDPFKMSVPVLFDGLGDRTSQELMISHLSRMALPPSSGGEPPVVKVTGHSVPKPGPTQWVITDLSWGTNVIWDFASNGVYARLRADCVVQLSEYRADDRVAFKGLLPGKRTASSGASKSGWPKTYIVKAGDTLKKIAARKDIYGDASKWKKIGDANGIRDPNSVKPKQKLRIPAP